MGASSFVPLNMIGVGFIFPFLIASCLSPHLAVAKDGVTRHYTLDVKMQNVTRLCHTRSIVTVNGKYPGPAIVAREGEWFKSDPEAIISQALQTGGGPNVSDAYTINGLPGPLYNCSAKVLEYAAGDGSSKQRPQFKPTLPALNDTSFVTNFSKNLRSLASNNFPANVPTKVDRQFFFTIGLGTNPCDRKNHTCQGPNGTMFAASINNVSFSMPTTALLQAHFTGQSNGVYNPNFPTHPLTRFNYTGNPPNNTMVSNGTKLVVLPFNTSVELILQDTSILGAESHPLHLHGFNFFVVGQGFGNFNPNNDPKNFNLVDPVERNTVGVPSGGWVAIRFLADNPGE
ncbi:hypothetical protein SAY87_001914 [Trapa incisa]|uniref:Laccase n=1 Tax=Trapa incisa TaxID=236973 RepID=A0AAN7JSH1_9MYRT|nr:hypothetical protein SAY87_001914 [Trapa incisa]